MSIRTTMGYTVGGQDWSASVARNILLKYQNLKRRSKPIDRKGEEESRLSCYSSVTMQKA